MRTAAVSEPPIEVEGCLACNAVWLDAPTFENLTGGVIETTNSLAAQATEVYAEIKLKELKDRQETEDAVKRKRKKRIADL
jgi:Zn-finger nucleic acid-binding protein